jgi:hypothetical protein
MHPMPLPTIVTKNQILAGQPINLTVGRKNRDIPSATQPKQ